MLREELVMLHEPASHVAEVVKSMGKTKVNVKVRGGLFCSGRKAGGLLILHCCLPKGATGGQVHCRT
jgi:hypothetical protein